MPHANFNPLLLLQSLSGTQISQAPLGVVYWHPMMAKQKQGLYLTLQLLSTQPALYCSPA